MSSWGGHSVGRARSASRRLRNSFPPDSSRRKTPAASPRLCSTRRDKSSSVPRRTRNGVFATSLGRKETFKTRTLDDVAFVMLRLSFSGAPNPPTWCSFSEIVSDLSNELHLCKEWDHDQVHSPDQPESQEPILVDDDGPPAPARPMAVVIPTTSTARTDAFIDDLIRVFLDKLRNRLRQPKVVPLSVHVASRPISASEPLRPQVLEWANNMSSDMINFDTFLDVGLYDIAAPSDPRTRRRIVPLNGARVIPMSPFNLHD